LQLILFIGIQATGKSSFYRERFADTHLRLNLDMLRTRRREALLFEACLKGKVNVVIDNTNATREDRLRYIPPAAAAGFTVVGYFFQARLEDALRRNAGRGGAAQIPEAGIRAMSRRLELPDPAEGFDELYFVSLDDQGRFQVEAWRS